MEGSNPKVSFIPKGSLVREESFLERRRPQSAIGLLSGVVFILSVSSFGGLYYYNNKLNIIIAEKTSEIDKTKQAFSNAPEVAEARVFRARTDLASKLLKSHRVVSPVFLFLSENTTESILYENFSFKSDSSGTTIDLGGEAPNYASLAFQADVFKKKTDELLEFKIDNVSLTKFGNITFNITMVFNPDFLLYTKNVGGRGVTESISSEVEDTILESVPDIIVPVSKIETVSIPTKETEVVSTDDTVVSLDTDLEPEAVTQSLPGGWTEVSQDATGTPALGVSGEQSMLRKLWSVFKFW